MSQNRKVSSKRLMAWGVCLNTLLIMVLVTVTLSTARLSEETAQLDGLGKLREASYPSSRLDRFSDEKGPLPAGRRDVHGRYGRDNQPGERSSSSGLELVGRWPLGFARAVVADPSTGAIYLASGLGVLILSGTTYLGPLGSVAAHEEVNGVYYNNDTLYVADDTGLLVIDVSDPARAVEVGFFETPGWGKGAMRVCVSGSYAYLVDVFGLRVIDVSDPARPVEAGFLDTGYAEGVYVSGSYAYVADGFGLRVIDVSDPAHPVEVGFCETDGCALGIYVAGSYAVTDHRVQATVFRHPAHKFLLPL